MKEFKTMINFIGEQPVPNYVPVKWGKNNLGINKVVSLYTDRTQRINDRLNKFYKKKFGLNTESIKVDPYDITNTQHEIEQLIGKVDNPNPILNLTGGTKPMTFAGYSVSIGRKIPFLYFQSEGGVMKIRMYKFKEDGTIVSLEPKKIEENIYDLKDYLSIHFDKFSIGNKRRHGGYFKDNIGELIENEIIDTLKNNKIEVFPGVNIPPDIQIDLFVKHGHNVGIVEVKKTLKVTAINQIALPSRQVRLGTYVRRIVIGGPPRDKTEMDNIINRAEIANVCVIQLDSLKANLISQEDKEELISKVKSCLKNPTAGNLKK